MTNTKRPRTSPASVCTSKPWNVCSAARTRSFWMRVAAAAAQSLICRSASSLVHRKRVANRRRGGGNETEFFRRHPCSSWRSRADRRFLVFVHRLSDAAGAGGPPWPTGPCGQRARSERQGAIHRLGCLFRQIPIVFTQVPDPIGAGFVESLARPGGNATGFTTFEYGFGAKWLELLKQIAPGVKRVAVLRDPANPAASGQWGAIQSAASSAGVELTSISTRVATEEIERAITSFRAVAALALVICCAAEHAFEVSCRFFFEQTQSGPFMRLS